MNFKWRIFSFRINRDSLC